MTFEGEHAPAAGQVPLLDGRVRRPGDDVTVVDEYAGDVPLVASNGWVSRVKAKLRQLMSRHVNFIYGKKYCFV